MGHNVLLTGKKHTDRTKVQEVYVDVSNELIMIDHYHSKVHAGALFATGLENDAVLDNGILELLVIPDGTHAVHANFFGACGGDSKLEVFEAPTVTANGTALTPTCYNRTSTNTLGAAVYHTPTTTADGTTLDAPTLLPGGSGGNSGGAVGTAGELEYILDKNTKYLIRITNIAGVTKPAHVHMVAYEVTQ